MESIFLSHHFDDDVEPVVESFTRLIRSHDLEVIDGRRLQGQLVLAAVQKKIEKADAVVVFLSKRESGKTNDWVQQERIIAQTLGKPVIAIIEDGVANTAPFSGFETLQYHADDLVETLLQLSETIFGWKMELGEQVEAHLEPDDVVATVIENANLQGVVQYRFLKRRSWGEWQEAMVVPRPGGVSLLLNGVTRDSQMQIRVSTNNGTWNSAVVNRNLRILVS